ncbi:MAG: cobalt-precorrin 5A hydrolase [Tissierellia bacterium]|nr:cobalt-precorrin 5A hydrolase [Tissierellia bacterium]
MIAYLCFTDNGEYIGNLLKDKIKGDVFRSKTGEFSIKEDFSSIWKTYDMIVFISATGIAVRFIAPYLEGKDKDPGVLVIDDMGQNVISLLSGHLGGANAFTRKVADILKAQPIITTATDGRSLEGLDLYAQRMGFHIEDLHSLTPFTGKMVNGEKISVYNPNDFPLPKYDHWIRVHENDNVKDVLAITEKICNFKGLTGYLRPKNLHLGVGSRKDVDEKVLIDVIQKTFKKYQLSTQSIVDIATIPIKAKEKTITAAAEFFKVPLIIYDIEELKPFDHFFKGSEFVRETVGIGSVSATCAYKSAKKLLAEKISENGVTLSISKEV